MTSLVRRTSDFRRLYRRIYLTCDEDSVRASARHEHGSMGFQPLHATGPRGLVLMAKAQLPPRIASKHKYASILWKSDMFEILV